MRNNNHTKISAYGNEGSNRILYGVVGFLSAGLIFTSFVPGIYSDTSNASEQSEGTGKEASEELLPREEIFVGDGADPEEAPYAQSPAFGPVTIEDRLKALEAENGEAESLSDVDVASPKVGSVSGFPMEYEDRALELAKEVRDSVVQITGTSQDRGFGTGWLIAPDVVVTNEHVADYDPNYYGRIAVRTVDNVRVAGEVTYTDSYRDIALIKLDRELDKPTLTLTDSLVNEGEPVIAVGHPDRIENWATMAGLVTNNDYYEGESILTSLPTSSGASGSPILNLEGEVVGIVSGIYWSEGDPSLADAPVDIRLHTLLPRINNAGGSNHIMLREMFEANGIEY